MKINTADYSVDNQGVVQLSPRLRAWVDSGNAFDRHGLHHLICRDLCRSNSSTEARPDFGQEMEARGIAMLPGVLSKEHCSSFSAMIDSHCTRASRRAKDNPPTTFDVPWSHQSGGLFRELLPEILDDEMTDAISAYYGCHFQVLSAKLSRHLPDQAPLDSFMWHRDHEPPQQLHMIIYLSGASDDKGATHVLDLETSRRAALNGYSYPAVENRHSDLAKVIGEDADENSVCRPDLPPGGAIVFGAPRVLHRGIRPKDTFRDTLLLIFYPSPVPWHERIRFNFRNVLRNGPSLNIGFIDPFDTVCGTENHGDAPEWARQCHLLPPDGTFAGLPGAT